MIIKIFNNPTTKKRLLRFKEIKRAHISLWILVILYAVSLCSELICNSAPLYLRFNEKSYFPALKFYSEYLFTENEKKTRPDYKKINNSPAFKKNPDNFMIFPLIPYGPFESIDPKSIAVSDSVTIIFTPMPRIGTVNIRKDYSIARSASFDSFSDKEDKKVKNHVLTEYFSIPKSLKTAIKKRFANRKASSVFSNAIKGHNGIEAVIHLSTFSPRKKSPETVRLTFREVWPENKKIYKLVFDKDPEKGIRGEELKKKIWDSLYIEGGWPVEKDRKMLSELVQKRFSGHIDPLMLTIEGKLYNVSFVKEEVCFPFAPVKGHLMGIDGAGRDVLARILYGLKTSLAFGFLLVVCSMTTGIITGSVQGYYGGVIDITGQRFIEIWSALPFLYIMILMGSTYGRSFSLLLFCYGLFNWIGISYYVRSEFLRLRKQAFVEAAKCLGISSHKIIFKHILPNAMAPVITLFPFSLVGAIGSLAALDYLGFGLPPPTPSWGELLFQAQQYRWAWWLILYPSMALFFVMLCGVFVGEGIRNAYDPKRYARLE